MQRMAAKMAIVALLAAAHAARLGAQAADSTSHRASNAFRFRLLGVYDAQSGEPVEGVEVADVLNGNKSLTSKTGTVSLFFLPDGGGLVRLRKVGYEVQTLMVAISPADTAPITVILSHAQQLAAVVVNDSAPHQYLSPMLRGFEERRRAGFGHFITDSIFRRDENETMADIITAHIPGVLMMTAHHGERYLTSSRGATCFISVYIDGEKLYDSGMSATLRPDFSRISPTEYAGAEFYTPATIPAEYNSTGSACGVLLLWTRER